MAFDRYLRQRRISSELNLRLTFSAQHAMIRRAENIPESDVVLFQMLSRPLQMEIHQEIYGKDLVQHPLFALYSREDQLALRNIYHSCVYEVHLSLSDILFAESE